MLAGKALEVRARAPPATAQNCWSDAVLKLDAEVNIKPPHLLASWHGTISNPGYRPFRAFQLGGSLDDAATPPGVVCQWGKTWQLLYTVAGIRRPA